MLHKHQRSMRFFNQQNEFMIQYPQEPQLVRTVMYRKNNGTQVDKTQTTDGSGVVADGEGTDVGRRGRPG